MSVRLGKIYTSNKYYFNLGVKKKKVTHHGHFPEYIILSISIVFKGRED